MSNYYHFTHGFKTLRELSLKCEEKKAAIKSCKIKINILINDFNREN